MVQRASEAVQFQSRDTRQVSQPTVAAAQLRPDYITQVGDITSTARLVQGILGKVAEGATQYANRELENRYLEGAAKAGQIKSESDIEGDFITRDWEVAGYRDTMGRMKMAQQQSKLHTDMVNLRAQSPEKFQEYLTAQRNEIMPQLDGMSREQRAASVGKLMLQEQADIALHTAEHKKFIIETDTKSYQATHEADRQRLIAARKSGSGEVMKAAVEATAGSIVGNLWVNSRLPEDVRASLTTDSIMGAIADGDANLYQYFAQNEVDLGKTGGKVRMLGMLSIEDQSKLSKAHSALKKDTENLRNTQLHNQQAVYEAQMQTGTFTSTMPEVTRFMDTMDLEGAWTSGNQRKAFLEKVMVYGYKAQNGTELAMAGRSNDISYILSKGKSTQDAVDAIGLDQTKRGFTPSERILDYAAAGNSGIKDPAYKAAGAIASGSIAQLDRTDGTIDEEHKKVLQTVNKLLDDWTKGGFDNTKEAFISGMNPKDQERLLRLRAFHNEGKSEQQALTSALQVEADLGKLTPQALASLQGSTAKEDREFIQGIEPMGQVSRLFSHLKFWSADAEALRRINPSTDWWSAESDGGKIIGAIAEQGRTQTLLEFNALNSTNPTASASDKHSVAISRVMARTIPTKTNPLIMPMGMNRAQYFGVPASTPIEDVGAAIDAYLGTAKGERYVFSTAQGVVSFQKYNDRGEEVGAGGTIKPNAIVPYLEEITDKRIKQYNETHGTGRKVIQDGVEFHYNGDNGAGVDERAMLQFRANLVKNESVRGQLYDDKTGKPIKSVQEATGKATVGVGITGDYLKGVKVDAEGKVSAADISNSFYKASNDAAYAAAQVQEKLRLKNDNWFLLLSEVAYQSGTNFISNKKYKDVLLNKDPEKAVELIQQTPAWQASGAERRKHYESLITKAMRG